MRYDFDKIIDRHNTNSIKFDFAVERGKPADVLPLWVADMDFPAPQPVLDRLREMVEHGIFGYSDVKDEYYDAVAGWFARRHGWRPEAEWLVKTPGVVFALAMAVRALTEPGDSVLIQPPVYYPFYEVIRANGRRIVESPLTYRDGRYEIDFADFEKQLSDSGAKLFILCSPHNPIGRVWTAAELKEIGRICLKHGVLVISDEIHCDFAFPEHPHSVFIQAVPEMAAHSIVCTAPSKTFNLAGLQASNIWIPDADIRARFQAEINRCGYSQLNAFGLAACAAAYAEGEEWFEQCTAYMRENLSYLRDYLAEHLPQIKLVEPEGTYFAWVDCSALGLSDGALEDLIVNKAKLWLDAGSIFSESAGQFERIVLACPRATLKEALDRLNRAING